MSRASCEPGDWKYHAMACAFAAAARPARPAAIERSFDPLILFFPRSLCPQSFLQLGAERNARFVVEMPPELQRLPLSMEHDMRAIDFNAYAPRIQLVAREARAFGQLDPEPAAHERDALIVGRVARLQHERSSE